MKSLHVHVLQYLQLQYKVHPILPQGFNRIHYKSDDDVNAVGLMLRYTRLRRRKKTNMHLLFMHDAWQKSEVKQLQANRNN